MRLMRGVTCLILLLFGLGAARGEILCGTWNMKWFPSGRAEHRASARVERANTDDAAELILAGLGNAATNTGVVVFLQELRDETALSNLTVRIARPGLRVAGVSAFRDWDRRLGWQQCGILTTLPVVESSWSYFRREGKVQPPRGFSFAVVDGGAQGLVACFCVHLKSNYRARTPEIRRQNAAKREAAARQIAALSKHLTVRDGRGVTHVLVAGDFNVDAWSAADKDEQTCPILVAAGFANCFEGLPLAQRGTHPGTGRFPDTTLDYIFHRGFVRARAPVLAPLVPLSDHRMVWLTLE